MPTNRIVLLAVTLGSLSGCSSLSDEGALSRSGPAAAALPGRRPDVHFLPTPQPVVDAMLELAQVGPDDVVYDLGSGDGRIVIEAARKYGARGVGIELDPKLVAEATRNAQLAGVAGRVTFKEGDIFDADISNATVVTLFLLSTINDRLTPKLRSELKPGARVVSYRFPMRDWQANQEIIVADEDVFLWTVVAPSVPK